MTSATGRQNGGREQMSLELMMPPMNQEAEKSVLGALLLHSEPGIVTRLVNRGLTPNSFYMSFHGNVFAAILALSQRKVMIDHLLVVDEMAKQGTRGPTTQADIDELAGWVPAAGNFIHYADIVLEYEEWRKRRLAVYTLADALNQRNEEAWSSAMADLAPVHSDEPASEVVLLRQVVNEEGEIVSNREEECPSCQALKDDVKGLNKDLTIWRVKYANLERNKEELAREDGMWQLGQRLFEIWKSLTGHRRSEFMWDRFNMCAPYLRNRKYGPRMIARGIVGISYDPFTPLRKNGTKKPQNGWDQLFKNTDRFEECCNCAPKDWEERIPAAHRPYVLGPVESSNGNGKPAQQQQLSVVGGR